jgi:6-phosphogluconolactonase
MRFKLNVLAAMSLVLPTLAMAGTFVYVSNADDGDISTYSLSAQTGHMTPGGRVPAAKLVMPMAASADGRFLYAISRAKPYSVYSYRIEPVSGALTWLGSSPLPSSMVNVIVDRSGRWLLSASYGDNTLAVHRLEADGRVAVEPTQVLPTGGVKPHSLRTEQNNRFLYVPHLGTDEIRVFSFDDKSGRLGTQDATVVKVKAGTGPRHSVISRDNRFVYVLAELTGSVTVFKRTSDQEGLAEIQIVSSLPADTKLVPGAPRVPVGTAGAVAFDESTAIWSADIQATPDGRFLYTSERTKGTLSRFEVDPTSGHIRLLGLTPTENQPRGFAIDPQGKYLIASGEKSDKLSVYGIDVANGDLKLIEQVSVGKGANWVQIVHRQ